MMTQPAYDKSIVNTIVQLSLVLFVTKMKRNRGHRIIKLVNADGGQAARWLTAEAMTVRNEGHFRHSSSPNESGSKETPRSAVRHSYVDHPHYSYGKAN